MSTRRGFFVLLALLAGVVVTTPLAREQERPPDPVATFSILGYDPATGEVGGAVQSRVFAGGGDTRGMQSAAMLIVKKNGGVWLHNDVVLRLQVDDNPEPLKELRRLVEIHAKRFGPR